MTKSSEPRYQDPTVAYNTGYADGQRDTFAALAKFCAEQASGPTDAPCTICKGTKVVNWGTRERIGGKTGPCICTPAGRRNVLGR
jgi:hypothetical protein